uniref:Uncharacterized protein n=1 Tax=Anguilla anguilla TaxID=7936 RepID=A0A0E9RMT5_ANGAN
MSNYLNLRVTARLAIVMEWRTPIDKTLITKLTNMYLPCLEELKQG